jgi:hypothetical protein
MKNKRIRGRLREKDGEGRRRRLKWGKGEDNEE